MENLFNKLVAETAKVAGVPKKALRVGKGPKKRWSDLALYWETHSHIFEGLFYKALFHIARGTKSPVKPRLTALAVLVEEAILDVPVALAEWRKFQAFKLAFFKVSTMTKENRRFKSIAMREFAYHRLHVRTFYQKEVQLKEQDLARLDFRKMKQVRTAAEIRHKFFQFKEIIKLILPAATAWPEDYFASPIRIFAEINSCHGFDYTGKEYLFDQMVWLLQRKLDDLPYYGHLFRVSYMPESIAGLIWPQDMEKDFCRRFLTLAHQKPKTFSMSSRARVGWDDPQMIVKTWAFNKLCRWRDNRSYPLPDSVRSAIMHYSMGIHPATV